MRKDFGTQLMALIKARGMRPADFAAKVGVRRSTVHLVVSGDRRLPDKHLGRWADALELVGAEREHFIEAAVLSGASDAVRRLVADLHCRLDAALGAGPAQPQPRRARPG